MLTRGNLEEKVEFAFQIYDDEEKGYLDLETYHKFVDTMVHASGFLHTYQADSFATMLTKLKDKLLSLAQGKESIMYIDVKKSLRKDSFLDYFENIEQNRQRGSTIAKIKASLETKRKKNGKEKIKEVSDDDEEVNDKNVLPRSQHITT